MSFSLLDNQHGVLVPIAVDTNGTPQPVTGISAVASDPTILNVVPDVAFNTDFDVTALGKDGTATVTVSGTNAAGAVISTVFVFIVTAPVPTDVATSFTATLINVANNS